MKKSEIYNVAQVCVLRDLRISEEVRLEVLRELMDKEDVGLFVEKQKEEAAQEE